MQANAYRYVWRNATQFAKGQRWCLATWRREHFSVNDLRDCNARCNYKEMWAERGGSNPSLRDAQYFRGAIDDMVYPMGIVAHPLGDDFEPHREWAEESGLHATLLPCASWQVHQLGICVLYTRPDTAIDQRGW